MNAHSRCEEPGKNNASTAWAALNDRISSPATSSAYVTLMLADVPDNLTGAFWPIGQKLAQVKGKCEPGGFQGKRTGSAIKWLQQLLDLNQPRSGNFSAFNNSGRTGRIDLTAGLARSSDRRLGAFRRSTDSRIFNPSATN
ncbi:hypothetical protein [Ruegeria lacuscaerulensis]|uniref:hypothetical protein n=1 Tax=Ruegeria lacuscaerulensis TaxID=55218 RepID=UPI00147F3C5B|nr:hypothetical protein [Ruegeria lacuscaerulensis]